MLRFGQYELDAERFELRVHGTPVRQPRQVIELVLFMAASQGHLVSKNDLISGPWRGVSVSDAAVRRGMMLAQHAVRVKPEGPSFIATVHGKGYRFIAELQAPSETVESAVKMGGAKRVNDFETVGWGFSEESWVTHLSRHSQREFDRWATHPQVSQQEAPDFPGPQLCQQTTVREALRVVRESSVEHSLPLGDSLLSPAEMQRPPGSMYRAPAR